GLRGSHCKMVRRPGPGLSDARAGARGLDDGRGARPGPVQLPGAAGTTLLRLAMLRRSVSPVRFCEASLTELIIMAGLGLIHLGFLAAPAAVAVPILIHLLLRPRAQRVNIGSLRFLKLVLRDSTRRRKVRRWLLLALRVLAVALLALLFARPYLIAS